MRSALLHRVAAETRGLARELTSCLGSHPFLFRLGALRYACIPRRIAGVLRLDPLSTNVLRRLGNPLRWGDVLEGASLQALCKDLRRPKEPRLCGRRLLFCFPLLEAPRTYWSAYA